MSPHPSYLELDRIALGAAPGEHVASCPRCRAYVDSVAPIDGAAPGWVGALAGGPRRPRWRWLGGGAMVLAVATIALVVAWPRPSRRPASTAKGGPAVAVHIKRGDHVFTWDGRAAIQPGDRLRLEVSPAGFAHVGVFTPTGERLLPLYHAELPGTAVLPPAWEVDRAPGPEILVVVLSDRPVADARLGALLSEGAWLATLRLPKGDALELPP